MTYISVSNFKIYLKYFSTLSNCYAVDTSTIYNRIFIFFHNDQFLFRKCADFLFYFCAPELMLGGPGEKQQVWVCVSFPDLKVSPVKETDQLHVQCVAKENFPSFAKFSTYSCEVYNQQPPNFSLLFMWSAPFYPYKQLLSVAFYLERKCDAWIPEWEYRVSLVFQKSCIFNLK